MIFLTSKICSPDVVCHDQHVSIAQTKIILVIIQNRLLISIRVERNDKTIRMHSVTFFAWVIRTQFVSFNYCFLAGFRKFLLERHEKYWNLIEASVLMSDKASRISTFTLEMKLAPFALFYRPGKLMWKIVVALDQNHLPPDFFLR